jgi:hypothetical protein
MKQRAFYSVAVFLGLFLLLALPPVWAQLTIGQYEDEAPFRTWNTFGIQTAPALGRGGAQFAVASDVSATVVNPALLPFLSKVSFTVNGLYQTASLYRYSIVNTGVLYSTGNSSIGIYAADFLGFSVTLKGWALGLSVGLTESYDRPHQNPVYEYQDQVLYSIDFMQDGLLRNYNLSLAKKFGGWLSVGIGANYVSGSMEKRIVEDYFYNGVTISDEKSHDFNGFYINGGVVVEAAKKLTLAVVFRTPYTKEADSQSLLRYNSSLGNTEINVEASARNSYKQPLVLGAGMNYDFSDALGVAVDVSYFNWSTYAVEYFEEELDRDFRNIIKIGGGLEYLGAVHLFQQDFEVPLRVGVSFDPQPMKSPSSSYFYFTLGLGIRWKGLRLDAGAMLGAERGSGDDLMGRKFSVSLSYFL